MYTGLLLLVLASLLFLFLGWKPSSGRVLCFFGWDFAWGLHRNCWIFANMHVSPSIAFDETRYHIQNAKVVT
jgi:hypothetical protein